MKYDNFLFRCSALTTLMTNSRSKSGLSETTKGKLEELWIEAEFGRKREVANKFVSKGNECEQDSIDMLNRKLGRTLTKNEKEYSNGFFSGTPDLIDGDIWDVKTSWDIWSFVKSDAYSAQKYYQYQVMGYMDLTGKTKAHIAYCLVDTPDGFIRDELYKLSFKLVPESEAYAKEEAQIRKNMTYADIPESKRVRIFDFAYDPKAVEEMKKRVISWREYMNSLSL